MFSSKRPLFDSNGLASKYQLQYFAFKMILTSLKSLPFNLSVWAPLRVANEEGILHSKTDRAEIKFTKQDNFTVSSSIMFACKYDHWCSLFVTCDVYITNATSNIQTRSLVQFDCCLYC